MHLKYDLFNKWYFSSRPFKRKKIISVTEAVQVLIEITKPEPLITEHTEFLKRKKMLFLLIRIAFIWIQFAEIDIYVLLFDGYFIT